MSGGQSNADVDMSTTLHLLDSIKHMLDRHRGTADGLMCYN